MVTCVGGGDQLTKMINQFLYLVLQPKAINIGSKLPQSLRNSQSYIAHFTIVYCVIQNCILRYSQSYIAFSPQLHIYKYQPHTSRTNFSRSKAFIISSSQSRSISTSSLGSIVMTSLISSASSSFISSSSSCSSSRGIPSLLSGGMYFPL